MWMREVRHRLPDARAVVRMLRHPRDEANIRRLASHLDCPIETARQVYVLARRDGYGAAHQAVFGDTPVGPVTASAGVTPGVAVAGVSGARAKQPAKVSRTGNRPPPRRVGPLP
jgi:hypothetical protein